jgi:2-methylcitrate synthase/citrate synthase II
MDTATQQYSPGLEGIIGGLSKISRVDPDIQSLMYRGYDVRELIERADFEQTAYLLIHGELPTASHAAFLEQLHRQATLPAEIVNTLSSLPKDTNPMDALRTGVSMLAHFEPLLNKSDHDSNIEKAIRLTAKIPTLITTAYRLQQGLDPIPPNTGLGHAANFLYMLTGTVPDEYTAKVFDTSFILYAEHGFNASTFAARVTCSTLSDIHSAITAAIGTLKGSLHGGANEEAMKMLLEIGELDQVEPWMMKALAEKRKIMGFGHRVYKNGDTRAPILKAMGESLAHKMGITKWHEMADKVEALMMREKNIHTNVDFPTAYIYYMMDLPIELYTPLFAASRITGWSAHVIEQLDNNRLYRPKSLYEGPKPRSVEPLTSR